MKKNFTLLLVATVFLTGLKAQVNTADSLALINLYNSTDGPHWKNNTRWLTTSPVRTWYGVKVNANRVVSLTLGYNGLKGVIPPSVGNLKKLINLNLSINSLTGAVPRSIGALVKLQQLDLSANLLTDSIPTSIGNLVNLLNLDLSSNKLSGSVPSSIGNMVNLQLMNLSSNLLTGQLPSTIGHLVNLTILDLSGNYFATPLPLAIGGMVELEEMQLSYCGFTGGIPASIGNLVKLRVMGLTTNNFTDTIPGSIGNCSNLEDLNLSFCAISGSIPASIGNCTKLIKLDARNNQLSGIIPASIGNCTELTSLYLNTNKLSGNIPSTLGNCTKLKYFFLSQNQLTGSFPGSLLTLHCTLNLDYNNLSGSIPVLPGIYHEYVDIESNNYNFSAFENTITKYERLDYVPQKTIPLHLNGNKLSVTAGGTLSENSYRWYKNLIYVKSTHGDSTFKIDGPGKYYVRAKSDLVPDLDLMSDTITVTEFTTNEPAQQDAVKANTMAVFPNPAKDVVYVDLDKVDQAIIKMYTEGGRFVKETQTTGKRTAVNISGLAAGSYFIEIYSNGITTRQRFIKQ